MSTVANSATRLPAVSVVIAAFADERWNQLCDAIESVRSQTAPVLETVVVIDHNPALLARARSEFTDCLVTANTGARGASGARNTGAASSHGEIVAFLDDDARSSERWLTALLGHFSREDIVGVGGRIDPLWAASRPRWFPVEFGWAVGFSYQGMPERAQPVRNVWAGNMAIRSSVFEAVGGFNEDFGKVGDVARPEDTDLCLRAAGDRNAALRQIRLRRFGLLRPEGQGFGDRRAARSSLDAADQTRDRGGRRLHHQDVRGEVIRATVIVHFILINSNRTLLSNWLVVSLPECGSNWLWPGLRK